jgi:uncharacterized protein YecT (DUF1311 family)
MPGHADPWWDELKEDAGLPRPPRDRTPIVVGAIAAVAISGGLAWWLASPSESRFENPPAARTAPFAEPVRIAAASADREQVRRAYEDFAAVYAASGTPGLARFTESCAASLQSDPRILDFCLAFDLFADAVTAEEAPGKAQARRLALVQIALPGATAPDARIEDVRRLMRQVSGVPERPAAAPLVEKAIDAPAQRGPAAGLTKATAREPVRTPPPRRAAAPAAKSAAIPYRCRLAQTTADQLVCANPALETQHRRMRQAYEAALAAGADPLEIDRVQATWRAARDGADSRTELSALYARRIRELNAEAAKDHPETPPT